MTKRFTHYSDAYGALNDPDSCREFMIEINIYSPNEYEFSDMMDLDTTQRVGLEHFPVEEQEYIKKCAQEVADRETEESSPEEWESEGDVWWYENE